MGLTINGFWLIYFGGIKEVVECFVALAVQNYLELGLLFGSVLFSRLLSKVRCGFLGEGGS